MNTKSTPIRLLLVIAVILFITGCIPFAASAADPDFEKSISAFPESYKPQLRQLHQAHPNWTFTPLITGLNWSDAVNGEYQYDNSVVVNNSAYTDIFKSREPDDYNAATGKYIEKDTGFVKANKLAISYYMDPRNFLTEEGIFQFENLSFSENFDADAIETVLAGTFMSNKKISYLNEKGKTVKTNETYAEVLYQAGKKYNINPCFLASKILSEVGSHGSGSVSGNYVNPRTGLSLYPGIYNFYNIGATDTLASESSTPIEKGLSWAKNGTTYRRPWNTPKKSIFGGAEFNAEKYISKGQHTSYLQRFNVNPACTYPPYTHQYMSALTGAALPAYTNFHSYLSGGLIDFPFNFVIPVYKNMTGASNKSGTVKAADSYNQIGAFSSASASFNVRQGPSTANALCSFKADSGTTATILDNVFTDSRICDSIMRYPYWRKVSFKNGSTVNTGYVYSNFINLSTYTIVGTGYYTPVEFKTNSSLSLRFISSDPSVATVVNDRTIHFLKTGTVEITAYDSIGNYQVIKYKVIKSAADYNINNVKVSQDQNGAIKVSFSKNDYYNNYEVFVTSTSNNVLKSVTVSTNSATISGIPANQDVRIYVRGLNKSSSKKIYSSFSSPVALVMKPAVPKNVTAVQYGYHSVKISWNKVDGTAGYVIETYDKTTGKRTKLAEVPASSLSYFDKSQNLMTGATYQVRAYRKSGSAYVYSGYSEEAVFSASTISVKAVTGIRQTSTSSSGYTLTWNEVFDADYYEIYRYDSKTKKYVKIATSAKPQFKVTNLSPVKTAKYRVKAVVTLFGKYYRSNYSSLYTACTAPLSPSKIIQSSTTGTSYTLKWSSVKNADGYTLYRYDSGKKSYVKVTDTKSTSYKVTSLKPGRSVKYKVKAFVKSANGTIYSSTVSLTASTCPAEVTSIKLKSTTTSSYTLAWNKVSNATGYRVYRYDSAKKKYVKLTSTSKNYLKVSGKKPGQSDLYKIMAFTKTDSGYVFSGYSKSFKAVTKTR